MTPTGAVKIAAALAEVGSKTIDRVFVVHHPDRFQLIIAFADNTYYEFYGSGELSGARRIDRGNAAAIRDMLSHERCEVVETSMLSNDR
jgi:hypothetical protein